MKDKHTELLKLNKASLLHLCEEATHQHYKGGLYRFIGEAIHTETNEELVLYEHVYPYEKSFYARPKAMFYSAGRFIEIKEVI